MKYVSYVTTTQGRGDIILTDHPAASDYNGLVTYFTASDSDMSYCFWLGADADA
jgi:hypothetical protein